MKGITLTRSGGASIFKIDASAYHRLGTALTTIELKTAYVRVINRLGDATFPRVVRIVAKEMGSSPAGVRKEIRKQPARAEPEYHIIAHGRHWPLKRFGPRQAKKGISAAPWARRLTFAGSFLGPNAHVYHRLGKPRYPIQKLYGPSVPGQMIEGTTGAVLNEIAGDILPKRLIHETGRMIAQAKARYRL